MALKASGQINAIPWDRSIHDSSDFLAHGLYMHLCDARAYLLSRIIFVLIIFSFLITFTFLDDVTRIQGGHVNHYGTIISVAFPLSAFRLAFALRISIFC